MPFTKVTAAGIESSANFIAQNLSVTGVITASNGIQGIGIQSGRLNVTTGIITALNFIGAGNTITYNSSTKTVDISIGSGNWTFLDELNTNTSNIYRLNGNVGIGTTNASSTFTVRGNSLITGVSTFQGISTFQSNVNIAGTVAIGTAINIIPYNSLNSGTLSFEGSAGQLFSITNNLTSGSIFSVNNVSGIPSINVDAAGVVELVPFNGRVGVGTTNPSASYKFNVAGNGRFSQDIVVNSVNIGCGGISTTNVVVGAGAGTSGAASENVFVGAGVGRSVTSGYRNTVIGYQAMYNNDIGPTNTAIGFQALYSLNGYTYYNTAVGRGALSSLTSGTSNIAMGHNSGGNVITGSGNVCINSGGPTTGSSNLWISGAGSTAGSSNILIGGNITASTGTESYNVILGGVTAAGGINNNIIVGDGQGNVRVRVSAAGSFAFNNPPVGFSTNRNYHFYTSGNGIFDNTSFYFESGADAGSYPGRQYGIYVSQGGARYTNQTALYATHSNTIGNYAGNYRGVHGVTFYSTQAGGTTEAIFGETTLTDWNYQGRHCAVRGIAQGGSTTFSNTYGLGPSNGAFGGHFVAYGKADVCGVYADAYQLASPGAGTQAVPLMVATNGSEILRVTTDRYIRMQGNSGGIQFNGDTAAANALDDYEEGIWTPTLTFTGGGTPTYSHQWGLYTKVGQIIHIGGYLNVSSLSGCSGTARLVLPFTTFSTSFYYHGPAIGYYGGLTGITAYGLGLDIAPNGSLGTFFYGNGTGITALTTTNMTNNFYIEWAFTYRANS